MRRGVLGIYVSGHPLQAYEGLWRSRVTASASDFVLEEDSESRLTDRQKAVIGGMISEKKIKYTKNDQVMAFLTIEDMTGNVEVIVFPRTYEESADILNEDSKIFIRGRVSLEEEKDGKLIAEKIVSFDDVPRRVWLRFSSFENWKDKEQAVLRTVAEHGGRDQVVIYIEDRKVKKTLPPGQGIRADDTVIGLLGGICGARNVVLQ